MIGGGEGQHGVPVTIGGDGFLVGEGHTAAPPASIRTTAPFISGVKTPVAVNQNARWRRSSDERPRIVAVAEIQIAPSTAVPGRQAAGPVFRSRVWLTA